MPKMNQFQVACFFNQRTTVLTYSIPSHVLIDLHHHSWCVAIDITIDSVHHIAFLKFYMWGTLPLWNTFHIISDIPTPVFIDYIPDGSEFSRVVVSPLVTRVKNTSPARY